MGIQSVAAQRGHPKYFGKERECLVLDKWKGYEGMKVVTARGNWNAWRILIYLMKAYM